MIEEANAKPSRKMKHLELYDTITQLDRIKYELSTLKLMIEDIEEEPTKSEPDQRIVSLATVLDQGPGMIAEHIDQCLTYIKDIKQLLF